MRYVPDHFTKNVYYDSLNEELADGYQQLVYDSQDKLAREVFHLLRVL